MNVELALKIGMLVFAICSISAIQMLRKRVELLEVLFVACMNELKELKGENNGIDT
jgi:hypothetical protein